MMSELDDLRDQKTQTTSELDDLRLQNAQLMSELDDLRDQKTQTTSESDDLRLQNAQLMSELDDLRDQKTQTTSESDDLKHQNAQLMSELDDLRDQKTQTTSESDDLRHQNAQLTSELVDLESQRGEDTRYWERLYQKCRKRRDSLKRRNKHMQAEHGIGQDGVGRTNLKLRSENDLLQEKLDSYKATFQFEEAEPFAEEFRAQNLQKVVEHVDLSLMKINKVLQGQDALLSIEKLDYVEGSYISALFERSFGIKSNVDDSGESTFTITEICGTKLRSVVLGLVSAALCIWVFEAEVGALFQGNDLAYSKLQSLMAAQSQ